MKNVTMEVKESILVIKVDLRKTIGPSKSRKTTIIASTEGAVSAPGQDTVKVNLNVYK